MDPDLDSQPLLRAGATPVDRLPLPPSVRGFEVERLIGTGASADVWLARQTGRLERRVAIKVLRHDRIDRERLARFQVEARALSAVDDDRFVRPFEAGLCDDGRPYLAMEYFEGEPLASDAAGEGLSLDARVAAVAELAGAIGVLHTSGILHRDIKPGNVLLERGDRPRLRVIDLGLAKFTSRGGPGLTHDGALVGTPEFMSPEQAGTVLAEVGAASDVFSIGVMLYALVEGVLPWSVPATEVAGSRAAAYQRLLRDLPPAVPSGCDSRLASIVLRAIASDPRARFRNALELRDALEAWRREGSGRTRLKVSLGVAAGRIGRSLTRPAAIAGLVIACGAGAMWWATRSVATPAARETRVVWSTGEGWIESASMDGGDRRTIARGFHRPRGLDFDESGGFLYWADFGGRIERARLDGSERTVVASYPKAVNVDVFAGQLFWTVYGDQPCIWFARTDGVGPRQVTRAVKSPTGFRALGDGRFVFSDWDLNGIFLVERGSAPERIALVDGVYGIDARDGWVYFGDRTSERIVAVHADSREERTLVQGEAARGVWQVALDPDGTRIWWTRQGDAPAIASAEIRADGTIGESRTEWVVDAIPWGMAFATQERVTAGWSGRGTSGR